MIKLVTNCQRLVISILENTTCRITNLMDNYVKKSGDTMTGTLQTTSSFRALGSVGRIVTAKSADGSTTWGTLEVYKSSDTATRTVLYAFNPSDNNKNATISVHINGDEKWAECPGSSRDNSIVTTASHGSNYVRLGNGLQICRGSTGVGDQTVTFPQAFINTNYSIHATGNYTDTSSSACTFQNKSTTKCQIHSPGAISANWTAVGYWY